MQAFFPERFEEGLGYLVHHLMYAMRQGIGRECGKIGYELTPEELGVLLVLNREDGATQTQLSETLAKDKAVITRLLNGLVKKGLVRRLHDNKDRRVVRSYLTVMGKKAFCDLLPVIQGLIARGLDGISQEDFNTTRIVLRRVISNLKSAV